MKATILLLLFFPFFVSAQKGGAVSVSSYGAFGNNGQDEGQKIQDALNNATFRRVELDAGKVYYSSINLRVPSGKTFDGNGATIKPYATLPYSNVYFISTVSGTTHSAKDVSIAVTAGSNTFTYADAGSLTTGEIVELSGPVYLSTKEGNTYALGWYSVITNISGTTVTLQQPADTTFTASAIKQYRTGKNIHIKDMVVDMSGRTDGFGVELQHTTGSSIENLTFKGNETAQSDGIKIGITVTGVGNMVSHCVSYGTTNNIPGYSFASTGNYNTFEYCKAWANRHSYSSAGRSYISTHINYLYDTAYYTGATKPAVQFDWHANAWKSRAEGCYATVGENGNTGVQIRGCYDTAQYNTILMENNGNTLYAFALSENPVNALIQYNTIRVSGNGNSKAIYAYNNGYTRLENIRFINNITSTATVNIAVPMGVNFDLSGNKTEGKVFVAPLKNSNIKPQQQ